MFSRLQRGWMNEFVTLVQNTQKELFICCPFIKLNPVKIISRIIEKRHIEIKALTSFTLPYFIRGVSDIEAIELLTQIGEVKSLANLHSKVYIFDSTSAIVTSANLTTNGLQMNYEYGIKILDKMLISLIKKDMIKLYDSELSNPITEEKILDVKNLLATYFEEFPERKIKEQDEDITEVLCDDEIVPIVTRLTPWQKDVFEILTKIPKRIVKLEEVYSYENELKRKYPDNRFIKEKIRQQLQQLRDKGLIEFIDRGLYKKLW